MNKRTSETLRNSISEIRYPDFFKEELEVLKSNNLFRKLRVLETREDGKVFFENRELTLFCGNDYLGLSYHPRVIAALKKAAETHGAGAGAARLISGTSEHHAALEGKIASFKNKEAALIFTAGYLANLGVLTSLAGEGDLIVMDKLCHASLIDGARLSGAQIRVFPHKHYERCAEILEKAEGFKKKILVSDTVFSMDGDLADIPKLIEIKKKHQALLILDDAHGLGVFGKKGTGATENLEADIDVITATLSKSIGTIGGFAASSKLIREYLINTSRPFIFATALPPVICAAAHASFCVLEESAALRETLWKNVEQLYAGFRKIGISVPEQRSPIVPWMIGSEKTALEAAETLLKEGFLVPAVRTPSVPKGKARLRITLSASHTQETITRFLKAAAFLALKTSHNPE